MKVLLIVVSVPKDDVLYCQFLRLDNTGAWAIEVYPSLLCNRMSEHIDLYIKLKLVIFSFI